MPDSNNRPILYFDGVCNLCNSTVQFIIRHDAKKEFLFATLQSEQGKAAIAGVSRGANEAIDSVILYDSGNYYTRSTAALRIARRLRGLWPALYAAIILPRFLRDGVYKLVSKNRYKWFGKRNECMMPTPELKERFL